MAARRKYMKELYKQFVAAVRKALQAESDRINDVLKPVQAGDQRAAALAESLDLLAKIRGVDDLQQPLHIDSRGDFSIVSKKGFTADFCYDLNPNYPRTGVSPGAIMHPGNGGWCYMNHFQVERMVINACNDILCQHFDVSFYKVGEVYPDRPKVEHEKYFVATLAGDFEDVPKNIPLADTEVEAVALAVKFLNLHNLYQQEQQQGNQ